jgi:hypothetical protein
MYIHTYISHSREPYKNESHMSLRLIVAHRLTRYESGSRFSKVEHYSILANTSKGRGSLGSIAALSSTLLLPKLCLVLSRQREAGIRYRPSSDKFFVD